MTTQFINQLLTPLIFAVFSIGFGLIWFHNRKLNSAAFWAISYLCGTLAFFFDAKFDGRGDIVFLRYMTNNFYILIALFFAIGVVVRYNQPVPTKTLFGLTAIISALNGWFWFVDPDVIMRVHVISFGCTALLAVSLLSMRRAKLKMIDRYLFWLIAISAAQVSLNSILILGIFNEVLTIANYSGSTFMAVLNISVAIISISIAGVLILGFGMDIISDLKEQSDSDPLCGLFNRRAFENLANCEIEKARRMQTPLALVVCDIDHFKSINDDFGHATGDQVINVFANLLTLISRSSDISGRIGGEEFCLLLPTATARMALLVAETIRSRFGVECRDKINQEIIITASFGIAELRPGEGYQSLFKRADKAMYKAKRDGRDQVCEDGGAGEQDTRHISLQNS